MKSFTFSIQDLGCKVNQYESQVLRENFLRLGFEEDDPSSADVVVVNSCTVTEQADAKTRKMIRTIKRKNPGARIYVSGCYAVFPDDIRLLEGMDEVQRVIPNKNKYSIPGEAAASLGLDISGETTREEVSSFFMHTRAFVKVQDGCDQGCAYCKVCMVKGPSKSREAGDVIEETKRLVKKGYSEIVVTGICVGLFKGRGGESLADLLKKIGDIPGCFRVRLSSVEPNHISNELVDVLASSAKFCRHLHIPLQSGSDRILRLMGRKYSSRKFMDLVKRIRSKMPDAGITMDIMAGFPGESEKDFISTVEFLKKTKPSRLHVFGYSDRKGTRAYSLIGKNGRKTIDERVKGLIDMGHGLQLDFCKKFVGRAVDVLLEGKRKGDLLEGYTSEYVRAFIPVSAGDIGDIVSFVPSLVDTRNCSLIKGLEISGDNDFKRLV